MTEVIENVKKRLNFPILFRLTILMTILLAAIGGTIAWKNSSFFEQVSGEREESVNLVEVKTYSYHIETLIQMYIGKLKFFAVDLKREDPGFLSSILKQKFMTDEDLISVQVKESKDGEFVNVRQIYNEEYLKENKVELKNLKESSNKDLFKIFEGKMEVVSSNQGVPLIKISIPFFKDEFGNYSEIAVGYFKISKIQRAFAEIESKNIFLVDYKGNLVAHPDEKLVLKGESWSKFPTVAAAIKSKLSISQKYMDNKDKIHVLQAYAKTPYGLTVISTTAQSEIQLPAKIAREQSMYWLGIIVSVAFFLVFVFSSTITNPIEQLLGFTKEIAAGNYDVYPADSIKSRDELGDLALAFDEMTSGLREREKIRSMMDKFHGSSVTDSLLESDGELDRRGTKKPVTVYFSDIRGFTDFSERHTAEEVVVMLNEYFQIMVGVILKHGGVVDKFIGDAVMAVWGVPSASPDDEVNCLNACLEMRQGLDEYNKLRISRNQEPIRFGMGAHCGEVISGTIGSSDRMEFTIIGDNVNMAARIEASTKAFGTDLLISETLAKRVHGGFMLKKAGAVAVKGKAEPLKLYTVHGIRHANGTYELIQTPYSTYRSEKADKVEVV